MRSGWLVLGYYLLLTEFGVILRRARREGERLSSTGEPCALSQLLPRVSLGDFGRVKGICHPTMLIDVSQVLTVGITFEPIVIILNCQHVNVLLLFEC